MSFRNFPMVPRVVFGRGCFNQLDEIQIWNIISAYATLDEKSYSKLINTILRLQESEKDYGNSKTEGGQKVVIIYKTERDPSLRRDAFKIHGYDCMVCGFNFKKIFCLLRVGLKK